MTTEQSAEVSLLRSEVDRLNRKIEGMRSMHHNRIRFSTGEIAWFGQPAYSPDGVRLGKLIRDESGALSAQGVPSEECYPSHAAAILDREGEG